METNNKALSFADVIDAWLDEGRTVILTKQNGRIFPQVTLPVPEQFKESVVKPKIGFQPGSAA